MREAFALRIFVVCLEFEDMEILSIPESEENKLCILEDRRNLVNQWAKRCTHRPRGSFDLTFVFC